MIRREFLTASAALTTALATNRGFAALGKKNQYRKEIGIQLYTLRNQISEDVNAAIKAVADAGYFQVEPYGFPDATEMIQAAKDNGLKVNSSHFAWDSVVNPDEVGIPPFAEILQKAKDAGLTDLVIPYLADKNRKTLDDYRELCDRCNKAAEQAQEAGIQLSYHNHAFEFEPKEGGMTGYEIMIDRFSDKMHFEIDVFWVVVGGHDPAKLMRKLKGRVSQLHLKDLSKTITTPNFGSLPQEAFEELGDGSIAMEPIIKAAKRAGVKYCHVEQDHSPHPIQSVQQSIQHLQSM